MPFGSSATVIGIAALAVVLLMTVVLLRVVRRAGRSRAEVEQQLAASNRQVERLARQVEDLAAEVQADRSGRSAAVDDREYVITTLAEAVQVSGVADPRHVEVPSVASVAEELEEQAVARLSQVDTSTRLGARLAGAGVRTLAVAHGLRRALTQDNLDRASAEAHVARRRSRRTRRQELREARRLIRAVRAQQHERRTDAGRHESEDVA